MHVKRFEDAKPYEAPNHRGVVGLRLQGFEPGGRPTNGSAIRNSCPAAARGRTSTPFEKVYLVLGGRMKLIVGGDETVLGPMDSARSRPARCARSSIAAIMSARCWSSSPIRRE